MGLDPHRPQHICVVGKKGSGKSVLARRLFQTWPFDRLVLDVTGDVGAAHPEDRHGPTRELEHPLPVRWPVSWSESPGGGRRPLSLRFVPDMGSPTYVDDLDRCLGLAYTHRKTLVWVDEMGELFKVNRIPPWARRALHQGRHKELSMLLCGPRPIDVDPLVVGQADQVYVFKLPNPADRRRVADNIGWDPKEFDRLVLELPEHGFLRYTAYDGELDICDPLPKRLAA